MMEKLKQINKKELLLDILYDIIGGSLYAAGVYSFASKADFVTGGITGYAMILNYFIKTIPIGMWILILNIPIVLYDVPSRTVYDWRHYLAVIQRKPGALRNGAPFAELPEAFRKLQAQLLRRPGGEREMVDILAKGHEAAARTARRLGQPAPADGPLGALGPQPVHRAHHQRADAQPLVQAVHLVQAVEVPLQPHRAHRQQPWPATSRPWRSRRCIAPTRCESRSSHAAPATACRPAATGRSAWPESPRTPRSCASSLNLRIMFCLM